MFTLFLKFALATVKKNRNRHEKTRQRIVTIKTLET